MPLVYILLGASGSGRREVLFDLIQRGPDDDATNTVLICEDEQPSPLDEQLHALPHTTVLNWRREDGHAIECEPWPEDTGRIFLVTDGQENPVDQMEALKAWVIANDLEPAVVYTVVHMNLLNAHAKLAHWFRACIHFSDVVLLNRREGLPNKWVDDFAKAYQKECYPCLFELVKKGRVKAPAHLLYPEARRISPIFEELAPEEASFGAEIVIEDDEDASPDEEGADYVGEDPYLVRNPDGRRARPIPDIKAFLG